MRKEIVEDLIKQTEQFSNFNKTSVNTVRFMTTLSPNGEAKIIAIWMKIGRSGAFVDKDPKTRLVLGCLNYVLGKNSGIPHRERIKYLKEAGKIAIELNGKEKNLENWEEIKSKVISFQKAFPFVKAAGWDIAITDNGPVVIEVNDSWDRTGQLFIQRGWKFEIRDCFMEWDKMGYKPIVERFINNSSEKDLKKYQFLFK